MAKRKARTHLRGMSKRAKKNLRRGAHKGGLETAHRFGRKIKRSGYRKSKRG